MMMMMMIMTIPIVVTAAGIVTDVRIVHDWKAEPPGDRVSSSTCDNNSSSDDIK